MGLASHVQLFRASAAVSPASLYPSDCDMHPGANGYCVIARSWDFLRTERIRAGHGASRSDL